MTAGGGQEGPGHTRRGRVVRAAASGNARHIPVLLPQVLEALEPSAGKRFIDATYGAGGYSRAILDAAECRVLAFDRDPSAVAGGAEDVSRYQGRLLLHHGRFGDMEAAATALGFAPCDGVVLDIGVSSMQLDEPERGFSFMSDGPLDMRMSSEGVTAAAVVNDTEQDALANIIFELGEERRSRAIAAAIVRARGDGKITTTAELAGIVARVFGGRKVDGRHPATRTFQALRIYVNDELGELVRGLAAAERILAPGGRLAVVTFHSLEDRIVKRFLQERTGRTSGGSRHLPEIEAGAPPSFRFVNQRPVSPNEMEIRSNPRARSARLRWAVRTEAEAHALEEGGLGLPRIGGAPGV